MKSVNASDREIVNDLIEFVGGLELAISDEDLNATCRISGTSNCRSGQT